MCGIYLSINNNTSGNTNEFDSLTLNELKSRGPDGTFIIDKYSENIVFGFTRLAIRAINDGNQPYQDERFISVFNGELYNTDFLTKEINLKFPEEDVPSGDMQLLGLWIYLFGIQAITKVVGMFAGYIKIESKIFAIRDRVGEKPLYYGFHEDIFFISSILPKRVYDSTIVDDYTFISGITKNNLSNSLHILPPGSYFEIDQITIFNTKKISIFKYWQWPKRNKFSNGDSFKDFKNILIESIKSQLVSDVGLSVLLSGGIDSGIVAAVARQELGSELQAFTLSFENSDYDEARLAKITSKHLKLKHEVFQITYEDLATNVQPTLEAMDIPIFDTGALSLFSLTKEVSKSHKVSLSGDGGDELFRGYSLFDHLFVLNFVSKFPIKALLNLSARLISKYISSSEDYLGLELKVKRALSITSNKNLNPILGAISPIGGTELFDLISKRLKIYPETYPKVTTQKILERFYYDEILPKVYLVKADRMSMIHGLELRAPLLDYRVIESAFDLSEANIRFKGRKADLKKLGKDFLPSQILDSKKHGFSTPFHKVVKYLEMPQWKSCESEEEFNRFVEIWEKSKEGNEWASIPAWNLLVKEHFFNRGNSKES